MTAKQLLSSNSYIQFPRFLGNFIGVNEAVLLSALCDKDSWCEFNVKDYKGWFYYLREDIEFDTGLTESQQRTALKSLVNLGVIDSKRMEVPSKMFYSIDVDVLESILDDAYDVYKQRNSQKSENMTTSGIENMTTSGIENRTSTIDNNINIKINNKAPEPVRCSGVNNRRRNFRKEVQPLTDDLESGKVIDAEKKETKKATVLEKCIAEVSNAKYGFSSDVQSLLVEYINWATTGTDVKRVKDLRLWKAKLEALQNLIKQGQPGEKVVQQSIDNKWYKFVGIDETTERQRTNSYEGVKADTSHHIDNLSEKDRKRILAERKKNGVW